MGGMGGCIPVFVVPRDARVILPHAQWLNYCDFSYLVHVAPGKRNAASIMRAALARLERVTAAEARAKYRALREVRHVFVWRKPGPVPSAADYVLRAACAVARNYTAAASAELAHGQIESALESALEARDANEASVGYIDAGAAGKLEVSGSCVLA